MKHILISFLLITIAFSSLRGSDRMNQHQNNHQRSYSGSSTESYDDYSNQSSYDDQYYSEESNSEYSSSFSSSENSDLSYSDSDSDSDLSYSYSDSQDNSDSQDDQQKSHRPRPDKFTRSVFKTLKYIEKGILQDWRLTEDPILKNQIRILLIQKLENLLPIAENPVETIELQSVATKLPEENKEDHPRPPHPRPPQPNPEDEFANQVFETLHQIAQVILEQWNVEQDMDKKNQLRLNIIEQLGALLPQNE